MKITAQREIIIGIIEALATSVIGKGIAYKCNIKIQLGSSNSFIEVLPKDGQELLDKDIFWFGYISREYIT